MAHAAGYKHDIFISYAHNDNHTPDDTEGWVDRFQGWLESSLVRLRGLEKLSIWRDSERMSGNTVFSDEIKDAIDGSALFFALVSRNYLNSEYCLKELNWFYQRHGAIPSGLKVGNQHRIFTILLNNIPHDQYQQHLPPLIGTEGFAFHDGKDQNLSEFTPIKHQRFRKQLNRLADGVQVTLEPLENGLTTPVIKGMESPANIIYMADVAEPLQTFRSRLIAEIKGQQGTILPNVPPPWEFNPHADEIRKTMDKARYTIHLFDQWQGRTINDRQETTYPREQFAIAKESPALSLVWVPRELEIETIENPAQRQFLSECANDDRKHGNFEFVQTTQSDFINQVLEKMAIPVIETPPPSEDESFLVDTHHKDLEYAFDLARYLTQFGVDVEFNKESHDPLRSLSMFEQAIRQVKHLIIIFGKVAPAWVHARVKLALNAINEQIQCDHPCCLENIWVYKVPSSPEEDNLPQLPSVFNINILDNRHKSSIDKVVAGQLLGFPAGTGGGP